MKAGTQMDTNPQSYENDALRPVRMAALGPKTPPPGDEEPTKEPINEPVEEPEDDSEDEDESKTARHRMKAAADKILVGSKSPPTRHK